MSHRRLSLFEVKRKPNESQSTRSVSGNPNRTFQSAFNEVAIEITPSGSRSVCVESPTLVPIPKESRIAQTRMPVITGEAHYRGLLPIDGILTGQLGGNGGSLAVRQNTTSSYGSQPELAGEISFRDMLRVNGHIAGSVYSKTGTLIIDASAKVDANIEVGTTIINGTVRGDIVAQQRVELGACAIIHGNIWTRSIAIKDGAVFDGVCTMICDDAEPLARVATRAN